MKGYGQYCPVAKAAEVLDERWTLLVIRELVAGSTRFNDIHRGVPRMSRSLLAKRLRTLIDQGLVVHHEGSDAQTYELTTAGEELLDVIEVIGRWGMRWIDATVDGDLDPAFLLWDVRRRIDVDALPEGQTVMELAFTDLPSDVRRWWLLLSRQEVDVCEHDPGLDVDIVLTTPLRTFICIWRGDLGWDDALRSGILRLEGPSHLRRGVRDWLQLSHFASVIRP